MRVLVCCLVYGNRPYDLIHQNLEKAGFPFNVLFINKNGIANALNDGIDHMNHHGALIRFLSRVNKNELSNLQEEYGAIAYLSNDIEEPNDWLLIKVNALQTYPNAGIIASSLDYERTSIQSEHVISNWIISKEVTDTIGYFNENYFPYGPIDNEYNTRAVLAGFETYYAANCLAKHISSDDSDSAYGYSKLQKVDEYSNQYLQDIAEYQNGTKPLKISSRIIS